MPYTIKIKFKDSGNKGALVKNTDVQWVLKTDEDGIEISRGITPTDAQGFLSIPNVDNVEILMVQYTISGVSNEVKRISAQAAEKIANVLITGAVLVPIVAQQQVVVAPVRVCPLVVNADRDWLCYESVFNRVRNRKSNKKFEMGLYIIERDDVCVWFRDNLDPKILESLTSAFFPDYEPKDHLIYSNHIWEWKELEEMGEELTPRGKGLVASGKQYKVNLDSFVVLPYNYYDNNLSSRALGTKKLNEFSHQLVEAHKWDFWKTASRSCVVRVKRIKDKGVDWDTVRKQPKAPWFWDYSVGEPERTAKDFKDLDFLLKNPVDATGWKLPDSIHTPDMIDVSLKTGVTFVGSEEQSGSGKKDFLDENWIVSCLRSDYVVAVNKDMEAMKVVINEDKKLVVLTELLSITEKTSRDESAKEVINYEEVTITLKVNDGIQVRDLSPLDKSKIYLAPLNIPHVDIDLEKFQDEFACLGKTDSDEKEYWREFWRKHWAISLGEAKALFLLRYGLQHINPNPQNYLIEFEKGEKPKPKGRIIIRDLQDAAIHREVVWALYGDPTVLPLQGEQNRSILKNVSQPVIKYEFEKVPEKSQETGTIDKTQNFGPPGTQFLWQRFSAFGSANKLDTVKSHREAGRWKLFLATMARWGKSHNRAYVRCIEYQLGVNLTKIDWNSVPKPERYLDEKLEYEKVGGLCLGYDSISTSGDVGIPPKITGVGGGNFPGLIRQPPEDKSVASQSKRETLVDMFGEDDLDKFEEIKKTPCLIVTGSNFNKPTAKLGEIDVKTVLITTDKVPKLYLAVDDAVKTVFERKLLPVVITNADGGTVTYQSNSKNETDMGWEENAASKVHDYLKSKDGQQAIREYKARGWKPVSPKFCIKVLDAKGLPIEEFPLRLKRGDYETQWTDITDGNGEIQIYQYLSNECQLNLPNYDDVYVEVKLIKDWTEYEYSKGVIFERLGGFVAKIQFIAG